MLLLCRVEAVVGGVAVDGDRLFWRGVVGLEWVSDAAGEVVFGAVQGFA